jgi:hypothetical protein
MATPLADLLNGLVSDIDMRGEFEHSPREFLDAHGWRSLDVADLQEACYVLADGAPSDDAARWLAGGDALGLSDGDAADAMVGALVAIAPAAFDLDPADLDDLDDLDADADDDDDDDGWHDAPDADDAHTAARADEPDESTLRPPDADTTAESPDDTAIELEDGASEPPAAVDLEAEPEIVIDDYTTPLDTTVDARDTGDFGDDWDELI